MTLKIFETSSTLLEFIKFQDKHKGETYSETFYLLPEGDDSFKDFFDYCDDCTISPTKQQEFLDSIVIFANADGTGGQYGFWLQDGQKNIENSPIIFFGSEGFMHIFACNINELIKILSFGGEGLYGCEAHIYEDDEKEQYFQSFLRRNYNFNNFREWMTKTLNIEPISNWKTDYSNEVRSLTDKADNKYSKQFDTWLARYGLESF